MRRVSRRWLVVAGSLLLPAVTVAILGQRRQESRELEAVVSERRAPPANDGFALEGAFISNTRDGKRQLLLAGESFLLLNRIGWRGLLVYQNLKELHATHVDVELFQDESGPEALSSQSSLLETLAALGSLGGTSADRPSPGADDPDVLTRVVFRDLAIRMHLASERTVSISAGKARLNLDTKVLVFDSGATFLGADGTNLSAKRAALSDREIHFPAEYVVGGRRHVGGAVFAITPSGGFQRETSARPEVDATDAIEKREARILAGLLRHAPPYTRALLLALGRESPPTAGSQPRIRPLSPSASSKLE